MPSTSTRAPIAIRLRGVKSNRDRLPFLPAIVLEHPDLRPEPALKHQVEVAIAVQIGRRKRATVLGDIQSADAGEVVIPAAAPDVEHVRLPSGEPKFFVDLLAQRVPSVLIRRLRLRGHRRGRRHFPPEETLEIGFRRVGEHSGGDENLR